MVGLTQRRSNVLVIPFDSLVTLVTLTLEGGGVVGAVGVFARRQIYHHINVKEDQDC